MIPAFLLKNPLASILGIVGALALVAAGVQSLRLAWSQGEVQEAKLAFANFKTELANESLRVEREAKAASDRAIKELVDETRAIGLVASQAKTEVRLVQSNGGPCRVDPAYLAGIAGVQRVLGASGRGDQSKTRP
jgi:hypothetical protein